MHGVAQGFIHVLGSWSNKTKAHLHQCLSSQSPGTRLYCVRVPNTPEPSNKHFEELCTRTQIGDSKKEQNSTRYSGPEDWCHLRIFFPSIIHYTGIKSKLACSQMNPDVIAVVHIFGSSCKCLVYWITFNLPWEERSIKSLSDTREVSWGPNNADSDCKTMTTALCHFL